MGSFVIDRDILNTEAHRGTRRGNQSREVSSEASQGSSSAYLLYFSALIILREALKTNSQFLDLLGVLGIFSLVEVEVEASAVSSAERSRSK